jgi:nucleoside-diphosphate-sugar epimerase
MEVRMGKKHEIHTVVGAGEVGRKLAAELLDRGYPVRLVRRGEAGPPREGLTWLRGDITDPAFADEACRGSAVVYNCTNPPDYARWDGVLVPLYRSVLGAAGRAGARYVSLDCLYMLGLPDGPMSEDTPMRPRAHKGELREQLVREALVAHEAGEVHVTFGRASDFVGPQTPNSLFNDRFLSRAAEGKAVEVFGDPDLPRSYSYTPDVARGLAILGTDPRARERTVWMLPVLRTETTRELVEAFFAQTGHAPKLRRIPRWLLTTVGTVSPLVRALREMSYQWEHPFVVDDSRFREAFGVEATPVEEAVRATLEAHQASPGRAA